MKRYKNILVGKGSQLEEALAIKDDKERSKAAKKVYEATSARYEQMYSKEDRDWFENWQQN